MKTLAFLAALLLGSFVYGQAENPGTIIATVTNVNGNEGNVKFALFSADTFMKTEAEFIAIAEIKEGEAIGTFENIPVGTYAILAMHDKNNNKKMDFDANGMPVEDYGASGNALSYGPPNWNESNFEFDGTSKEIEIRF
jgi:uncharacterized protein (DUF2141 family)